MPQEIISDRLTLALRGRFRVVVQALVASVLLLVWLALSRVLGPSRLPGPRHVMAVWATTISHDAMIEAQGGGAWGYLPHVLSSMWHVTGGSCAGGVLGIALTLFASQQRFLHYMMSSFVELARAVPPLLFVPFAAILFGSSDWVRWTAIFFYSMLTISVHVDAALTELNPNLLSLSILLGARTRRHLSSVVLPGILPALVGPIRFVLAFSLGISVVTEFLVARDGIGRVMKLVVAYSNIDRLIVGIVWAVVLALVLDLAVVMALRPFLRWSERDRTLALVTR